MKLLTPDELRELTGYRTGKRQALWIRQTLGIEPMIGADGRPRLTESLMAEAILRRKFGRAAPGMVMPNWTKTG